MNDMASRSTFIDNAHFLIRCLRYRFRTEKLQIKTMMGLHLKGATVLDIGANNGIYCFWMMRAVGPSGNVIAFEPQLEMCDGIERQKLRFNWSNLRVMNVALSDLDGQKSLSRQRIGDGSATLEATRRRNTDATLWCRSKNPAALAQAMKSLATSPELRARYGKAARQLVVSRLSAKIIGNSIVQLYDELTLKHPNNRPDARSVGTSKASYFQMTHSPSTPLTLNTGWSVAMPS